MPITRKKRLSVAIALVCGGVAGSVQASGFRVPEGSIAGLGLSNALVANPNEAGALVYNPAAMAFHPGKTLSSGIMVIDPTNEVTNGAGTTEADGKDQFVKPDLYYMDHINSQWSWGVSVGSPYGLETKWPAGTFPNYGATLPSPPFPAGSVLPPQSFAPEKSKIEMVNVNPNISFKFNPDTSVAFGVDYFYVNQVNLNTTGVEIEGDGDAWGWNIAIMHRAGPVTLGMSYRSSVDTDIDGSVSGFGASGGATTSVEFPATLQLGIHYQINPEVAVEFDYDRTEWSSFDKVTVNHSNPVVPNPVVSENNWGDSEAFRLGVIYDMDPVNQLRFGYSYDNTPQYDAYFSARVPDADRQLFSIGYQRDMGGWNLEAAYMYVKVDDRTVSEFPSPPSFGLSDGKYESYVHLFGLGLNMTF